MKIQIDNYTDFSLNYKTSEDKWILEDKEIVKLLDSYIGKKAEFKYDNFYGSSDTIKIWITGYKRIESVKPYIKYIITLQCSKDIPDRFYPSMLQIGKQLSLVAPLSYQRL